LKQVSFSDKKIIQFLNQNYISISVDTDVQKALANKWKVKGLPLLWFLKPDGSKISNVPGYVDKDPFFKILNYIQSGSYEKMSFQEFNEK